MITIYHNPQCSKSRAALAVLESTQQQYIVQAYLYQHITANELNYILNLLSLNPIDLIRKNEAVFLEKFADKSFTHDQWLAIMVEYPILIERPIIIKNGRAIIGRPVEKVIEFLTS